MRLNISCRIVVVNMFTASPRVVKTLKMSDSWNWRPPRRSIWFLPFTGLGNITFSAVANILSLNNFELCRWCTSWLMSTESFVITWKYCYVLDTIYVWQLFCLLVQTVRSYFLSLSCRTTPIQIETDHICWLCYRSPKEAILLCGWWFTVIQPLLNGRLVNYSSHQYHFPREEGLSGCEALIISDTSTVVVVSLTHIKTDTHHAMPLKTLRSYRNHCESAIMLRSHYRSSDRKHGCMNWRTRVDRRSASLTAA